MSLHSPIPCGRSILLSLAWLLLAGPALASGAVHGGAAAPPPAPGASGGSKSSRPLDPLSLIEGDVDAWSVSNTPAGCYLMSPRRKASSRLALGRHPVLGGGLFVVGFALSMAGQDAQEPIGIETSPALIRRGRMAATGVLFVALGAPELAASAATLREADVLWVMVRGTGIAHRGKGLVAAINGYGTACVGTELMPAPPVGASGGSHE